MAVRAFPPSSDMVEFQTNQDTVWLYCLICGTPFGEEVLYLNQAIAQWYDHVESHQKIVSEKREEEKA